MSESAARAAIIIPSIGVDPLLERCVEGCRSGCPEAEIIVLVDDDRGIGRLVGADRVIVTGAITIGAKRNLGVQATDAEVVQEPTDQPYGVRDCAFRDPAGNMIRIQELR